MSLKLRFSASFVASAFAAALIFSLLSSSAPAALLYWDPGTTGGVAGSGPGNWDTTAGDNFWSDGSGSNSAWSNSTGAANTAVFGGTGGGAVNVNSPITVGAIAFNGPSYDLGGLTNTITLGNGSNGTVTVNQSATIDATISVPSGQFVAAGPGALYVTNPANSFAGGVNLNGGTLNFASGALGSTIPQINCNGGTLQWANGSNTQDVSSNLNIAGATAAYLNTNGNSVTFNSTINAGNGGTISGAGSVNSIWSGNSWWKGLYKVGSGTLTLANASALTGNGGWVYCMGGELVLAGAASSQLQRSQVYGSGTLLAAAANSLPGGKVDLFQNSTLQIGANNLTISQIVLDYGPSGAAVNVNTGTNSTTFSGGIGPWTSGTMTLTNLATDYLTNPTNTNNSNNAIYWPGTVACTLVKAGSGLLVLNGTAFYGSGQQSLVVNGGTLQLGNGGSAGDFAVVASSPGLNTVVDNALLVFDRAGTYNVGTAYNAALAKYLGISGSGNALFEGGGTTILAGSLNITGTTSISSGTFQVGNGGTGESLSSGSIGIGSGCALAFSNADTLTVSPSGGIGGAAR